MSNQQAWDYAIGSIKVDGLEPTEDFKKYIQKEIAGEATMKDLKQYLDKKYKMKEVANADPYLQGTGPCIFETISKKTLEDMDKAVANIKTGKVSEIADLSDF